MVHGAGRAAQAEDVGIGTAADFDPVDRERIDRRAAHRLEIAEGNVGVVRDRPDPNGGPPTHAVGRAEHGVYTASDGSVELRGMPKVQQGPNMHIATSAETVMIIDQDGHLNTHGPSRTEIRQEPNQDKSPSATASPSAKP